jgi:hypothetical protein
MGRVALIRALRERRAHRLKERETMDKEWPGDEW